MDGNIAPLMYGFLQPRLLTQVDDWEALLRAYARGEGFDLAAIFHEHGDGGAFAELVHELRRAEARHVIAPPMEHFDGLPSPRNVLLSRLNEIGAWAWGLPELATASQPKPQFPDGTR